MKVTIFLEGGGKGEFDNVRCRQAFHKLLEKANLPRHPALTPCGARSDAHDRFCTEWSKRKRDEMLLLLVDCEDPVTTGKWDHVARREGDHWEKPAGATEDHLWFMMQCMETWIVADRPTLARVFKNCLTENALPSLHQLEGKLKPIVQAALELATARCDRDRKYAKGKRSYQVVGALDPAELEKHLPHFRELIAHLRNLLR